MRYTYEYKRKCVELYREGKWPETLPGIKEENFHIRWVRLEESLGAEALKNKMQNREWTPEQRLEFVLKVLSGRSMKSVAIDAGISDGMLYQTLLWDAGNPYDGAPLAPDVNDHIAWYVAIMAAVPDEPERKGFINHKSSK